jgi:hypothetical protein
MDGSSESVAAALPQGGAAGCGAALAAVGSTPEAVAIRQPDGERGQGLHRVVVRFPCPLAALALGEV